MLPDGFTSDGCTGFPDTWRGIDLSTCCEVHDLAWYLNPGDWQAWLVSNLELSACFADAGAWELSIPALVATCTIGALMFAGWLGRRRHHQPPTS